MARADNDERRRLVLGKLADAPGGRAQKADAGPDYEALLPETARYFVERVLGTILDRFHHGLVRHIERTDGLDPAQQQAGLGSTRERFGEGERVTDSSLPS